ncbi:hypothetical protein [Natrinema sp. CGMCC1.2065]|uniref:hypothetical protein n=1 Tax=Natrinema sp. CGMCC1.2065 TaxID=3445767 RepID=UPI003F4A7ACC
MYEIEGGFDGEDLKSNLSEVQLERRSELADGPLRTRFMEINETTNGISCVIQYEIEIERSGWDGVEYERERHQARIRFTDVIGEGGVLIVAKGDHQSIIASRLIDFFGVGPNPSAAGTADSLGIARVEISEENLKNILSDDGNVESRATYDSIDENTSSASLAGALGDSSPASEFNERGNKRWVIFESLSFERKVGITVKNDAVVFWGDWNDAEMERYWSRIVLPNLD